MGIVRKDFYAPFTSKHIHTPNFTRYMSLGTQERQYEQYGLCENAIFDGPFFSDDPINQIK